MYSRYNKKSTEVEYPCSKFIDHIKYTQQL